MIHCTDRRGVKVLQNIKKKEEEARQRAVSHIELADRPANSPGTQSLGLRSGVNKIKKRTTVSMHAHKRRTRGSKPRNQGRQPHNPSPATSRSRNQSTPNSVPAETSCGAPRERKPVDRRKASQEKWGWLDKGASSRQTCPIVQVILNGSKPVVRESTNHPETSARTDSRNAKMRGEECGDFRFF
jgi:hypothetical protein